jgi:hypothetical protein
VSDNADKIQRIPAAALATLARLPEATLAKLAKEKYFPKADAAGTYPLTAAVQGCFRYYAEQDQSGLPTYESMAVCQTATGIPKTILKQAKKESVFRAHRIPLQALLKWIFSKDGNSVDWGERNKKADALIKEHRLDQIKKLILDKDSVAFGINKAISMLFATFDRLSDQLPPVLHGMDAAGIKAKLAEATERLKGELRAEFEKLFA